MKININHRELTNYESWQQEKYGNILSEYIPLGDGKFAVDEEEQRRLAEWINMHEQRHMEEHAAHYGCSEGMLK